MLIRPAGRTPGVTDRIARLSSQTEYVGNRLFEVAESVCGFNQGAGDARFANRMPGIGDDLKLGFRPRPVEFPGTHHRTDNIVSSLNNHRRDGANLANIFDQVVVQSQEKQLFTK